MNTMNTLKLRIASCNLQNLNELSPEYKIEHFVRALQDPLLLPDIIALQEIGASNSTDESVAVATVAQTLIDTIKVQANVQYYYIDMPPITGSTGGAADFNIRPAFLVKANIKVSHIEEIGVEEPAFKGDESLNFKASRKPLAMTINVDDQQLIFINCHLKSQNARTNQEKKLTKKQRNRQAEIIAEYCQSHHLKQPIILLGDFNDTPNSDTLKILQGGHYISAWDDYTGRLYTTKHRNCPIVLDYFLIDKRLSLLNPQVHHINTNLKYSYRFSDHDPISVEIVCP